MSESSLLWLSSSTELYHAGFLCKKAGPSAAPIVLTDGGSPVSIASLVQQAAGFDSASAASSVHHLNAKWESAVALDVAGSQVSLSLRELAESASAPPSPLPAVAAALQVR